MDSNGKSSMNSTVSFCGCSTEYLKINSFSSELSNLTVHLIIFLSSIIAPTSGSFKSLLEVFFGFTSIGESNLI